MEHRPTQTTSQKDKRNSGGQGSLPVSPRSTSGQRRHQSSKGRSTKSSSPATREPVPIRNIEVDARQSEEEGEEQEDRKQNLLAALIEKCDWENVTLHLKTATGIADAGRPLVSGDYPLHTLCQCGSRLDVPKYGTISRQKILQRREKGASSGSEGSQQHIFPPNSILLDVITACPFAATAVGSFGSLPLHHAVRHLYPTELLITLIRAYPQALDIRDDGMRTPREFEPTMEESTARSAFRRPTSCWLQQLHDEGIHNGMEDELKQLEEEVEMLMKELNASRMEEEELAAQANAIEKEVMSLGDFHQISTLSKRGQAIKDDLELEMNVIRAEMETLARQMKTKYAEEEKERALMSTFNNDVVLVYKNANDGLAELRAELENVKTDSM